MKCPSCGWTDDPIKDARTGEVIDPKKDAYNVYPDGRCILVKNEPSTDPTPPAP